MWTPNVHIFKTLSECQCHVITWGWGQSGLDEAMGVAPMMVLVALLDKEGILKIALWYPTKRCPLPHDNTARRLSPDAITKLLHFKTVNCLALNYTLPKLCSWVTETENTDTHSMYPFLLPWASVSALWHNTIFNVILWALSCGQRRDNHFPRSPWPQTCLDACRLLRECSCMGGVGVCPCESFWDG